MGARKFDRTFWQSRQFRDVFPIRATSPYHLPVKVVVVLLEKLGKNMVDLKPVHGFIIGNIFPAPKICFLSV